MAQHRPSARTARLAFPLAVVLASAACASESPTGQPRARGPAEIACTEPARPSPVVRGDTLPLPVAKLEIEDRVMDAVSRQVPGGFGGLWGEEGRVVIALKDPSRAAAAREALAALVSTDPRHISPVTAAGIRAARIVPARWSFTELYNWSAVTDPVIWEIEGTTTSDRDEYANRLTYGFIDEASMRQAAERLGALGLPCRLVTLHVTGPIRA